MKRELAIAAAMMTLAGTAVAQPARSTCGGDDHGARARSERAFRAALKAKKLTLLTTPPADIITWDDRQPPGRPGTVVQVDHRAVLVVTQADEYSPPTIELVRDRKKQLWLVTRALDPTSTVTLQRCGCSHGGAAPQRLWYGVVVPTGAAIGGRMTIAYRGPQVVEQDPEECSRLP